MSVVGQLTANDSKGFKITIDGDDLLMLELINKMTVLPMPIL